MNNFDIKRQPGESEIDFINRVCMIKEFNPELTWRDVQDVVNTTLDFEYSDSWYRKNYTNKSFPKFLYGSADQFIEQLDPVNITKFDYSIDTNINPEADLLFELRKERIKNSDERSQMMAAVRRLAREETLLEIANQVALTLADKNILPNYEYIINTGEKAAILQLSDWHYGIEINNPWNTYNPEIAKDRILKLRARVYDICKANDVKYLYISNLGDLISGRIHETIRLQNRIDVITQSLHVAQMLVELMAWFSQYFTVRYISTTDNHSRLEPKKELSLDLESLTRVIDPLIKLQIENLQLKQQCGEVEFIESPYGPDIATFDVFGYKIGAVHGHKDSPKAVVNNVSLMTRANYDMILTAHLHHFSCDEQHNTVIVSNGSLMGVDEYAESLRLTNKPSQNVIIVSQESVAESIHRIALN